MGFIIDIDILLKFSMFAKRCFIALSFCLLSLIIVEKFEIVLKTFDKMN